MANFQSQPDLSGQQTRRAAWGAVLMLAAAAAYTLFSFWLIRQQSNWQLLTQTGVMTAYCVAVAAGWWLVNRGRLNLAGWVIITALWLTTFAISAVLAGLGWVMAAIAIVLTASVTALMLTGRAGARAVVGSLTVGSLILVLDQLDLLPWLRATVPALQVAAPVIAGLLALAYIGLVAQQFQRYALRTKLLIGFVVVAGLGIGALTLVIDQVTRSQLTQEAGAQVAILAANRASEIASALERQIDALQVVALNKFVQDSLEAADQTAPDTARRQALDAQWRAAADDDPLITDLITSELSNELREFQRAFPNNLEVMATDDTGALVATSTRTSDYDQSDEEWWQQARAKGLYIGQPQYDASTDSLGLILALAVPAHNRPEIVGVVRTTLSLEALAGPLLAGQFGRTGDTQIYLPTGWMVDAAPGGERRVWMAAAVFPAAALAAADPYQELSVDEVVSLVSRQRVASADAGSTAVAQALAGLDWYAVAHQTRAEALQLVETTSRATLLTAFVVLIVAGVTALILSQQLTRPLMSLTAVAARVSGGDLAAQAPVETDDEIGALATTFNVMTTQLRETLESLERRVAERTRALAASAEVSRRLAVIADEPTLVQAVVDEIQAAFGYYHAHVYLWDAAHENLLMAGGTGEAGRIMLARGHRLPRGRGLVGQAADTGAVVVVSDTAQSPVWAPNPLLPDTRSEVAVPIRLGQDVLGVLDVQHNVISGFAAEDVELLQSLANQVAVALQNARAYGVSQAAAARQAQINAISQQILGATTVADALQVAVREVGRALGGRAVRVRLTSDSPNERH